MKNSFIIFLILFAFSIASALNSIERVTIAEVANKCNNFAKKTYYDLLSMPGTNSTKLTFSLNSWFLTSTQCKAKTDPEIVMVAVSIMVEGTRRNIIELVTDKDKFIRVYTTDTSGSRTEVSKDLVDTTLCIYCSSQRYAVSIDLEKGLVSEYGQQYNFFTHNTKKDLNYEGWVIDDSIEITYSQAYTFPNFVIQYDTYNDEVSLFDFMVSPTPNILMGLYYTNENQGTTLTDSSTNTKKMGPLYFGENTATVAAANPNIDPTWSKGAVKFTKTEQYVKVPKVAYENMIGAKADGTGASNPLTKLSFTFSFWIKIDELPSQVSKILRFGDPATVTVNPYELFRISLKPDGKVVTKFGGVELGTTTDSLKVGEWTLLTVHMFGPVMKSTAILDIGATTYFNNIQQTNSTELKKIDPAWTEAALTASTKFGYLGGFLGEVAGLNVFSPGTNRVSYPSGLPSCLIDMGYDSPVCLARRCMDGTTTCFDPKTPPPSEAPIEEPTLTEVKKSEGYSGGTVAGIVIGTVAFVVVLGVAAFVIYYKTHVAAKLAKVRIAPEPTLPVVHPTEQTAHFMVGKTEPCDFSAMVKKGETMDLSTMIKKAEAAEAETAGLPQLDDKVSVEIPEKY